jgi:hypothetical protein
VRTAILVAVMLVSATFLAPAKEIVEIRVRGHYYAAPATVPVVVAVEPRAENRTLVVEADGEEYFRSSEVELDGEKEKRLHSLEFKSLPAGEYTLRAVVRSKSQVLATAVRELVVTGVTQELRP